MKQVDQTDGCENCEQAEHATTERNQGDSPKLQFQLAQYRGSNKLKLQFAHDLKVVDDFPD
jgi:hypothetical protein